MKETIYRQDAIEASRNKTVSTNPDEFYAHDKFIKFQKKPEIVSYGRWQWSNGFNTALVAEEIMLKKLPSAQKKGEWILNEESGIYECKNCGYVPSAEGFLYFNFCPNCGAEMHRMKDVEK